MAIESATTATVDKKAAANAKQFQLLFDYVIPVKVNFEEDSIASGASSAAVYTGITGVKQGDFVLVSAVSDLGDDIIFTAQATADGEVTVIATDGSAGANTSAATVSKLYLLVLGVNQAVWDNADSY